MARSSLHDNAGTLTPVGCVEPVNSELGEFEHPLVDLALSCRRFSGQVG
jgi:hypothetical protein